MAKQLKDFYEKGIDYIFQLKMKKEVIPWLIIFGRKWFESQWKQQNCSWTICKWNSNHWILREDSNSESSDKESESENEDSNSGIYEDAEKIIFTPPSGSPKQRMHSPVNELGNDRKRKGLPPRTSQSKRQCVKRSNISL